MKIVHYVRLLLILLLIVGCTEEKKYITQVVGPQDWQGPTVEWTSPLDADVRGTVGLDLSVRDSSRVTELRLYLDGRVKDTLFATPYRFEVVTDSVPDGVHLCEARAWDEHGNMGVSPILRINVANSMAQGPRVLWVPDSFQAIQAAINAATDFDTIRVRDGTYYETLNLFGKAIWIESEHGPLACTINASGTSNVFFIPPSHLASTIRGFTMTAAYIQVFMDDGARLDLFNNVFVSASTSDSTYSFIVTGSVGGHIVNNVFSRSRTAVQLFNFFGTFENNVIQQAWNYALWDAGRSENPVFHGYNTFWQNGYNYSGFSQGVGEFEADPLLDMADGRLLPGSPCIDAGDPEIQDRDNSRSDIGPFGGPLAY
jgi:hypothetical protein